MAGQRPTVGRIVLYRAKTGWLAPAVIAATQDTLDPDGVQRWRDSGGEVGKPGWQGIPELSSPEHLHLIVFSAGRQGNEPMPVVGLDSNMGGTFREWDVPLDPKGGNPEKGHWTWPTIR